MTKILKGDTSANITIAFATGYDYAGSTVHVDFLGARRSFASVTAGGTVSFNFTAEETKAMPLGTFPVHVTLVKNEMITTIKNGGVKIGVTDDISEVHAGAAIAVDVKGGLFGITDLPARYTDADVVAKLREILHKGGAALCAAFLCLGLFADTNRVQTARKDSIYNDAQVVTNVNFAGIATETYVQQQVLQAGVMTESGVRSIVTEMGSQFGKVQSVNGKTGTVDLVAEDVNAVNADYQIVTTNGLIVKKFGTPTWYVEYYKGSDGKFVLRTGHPKTNTLSTKYSDDGLFWYIYKTSWGESSANAGCLIRVSDGEGFWGSPLCGEIIDVPEETWEDPAQGVIVITNKFDKVTKIIELLSDGNSLVLTNGAVKTKSGTSITAAEVGAATASDISTAIAAAGHVTTTQFTPVSTAANNALVYAQGVYQYMHANTNAWFEGTNYNVDVALSLNKVRYSPEAWENVAYTPCSLQLYEIRNGSRQCVWDQRDWTVYYWNFKSAQLSNNLATATANLSNSVANNYMRKGWAKYTAVNGVTNPANDTLWVDTSKVSLMAGKQWEKMIELGGAGYWTLTGNGVTISTNVAQSTFLSIKDFEGNACLTFRKTSSYLAYVECGTEITNCFIDVQNRVCFTVNTDTCPIAEFTTVLEDDTFVEQGATGCPADYEWTGSAGAWVCHFKLKSGIVSNSCFARFKLEHEGENVVEHTVPVKLDGGIVFTQGGTQYKIKPSISGGNVVWSVVP